MILAGDIGGTKTNLALYQSTQEGVILGLQHQFVSQNYASFSDVINEFLAQVPNTKITTACFGIAGPIIDGRCRTTNLPWEIVTTDLQEVLNTKSVYLLNDLEATAYGMRYLPEDEFIDLNPNAQSKKGNYAVIAAGTGLGEAMLYFDGLSYHPIGSEGGHSDFAPQTPQQDALLVWLREHFPLHVSYERLLCGPGITNIYNFLVFTKFASEPDSIKELKSTEDKSALISRCALENNDPLCVETLRLFVEIYGAEAGNMALKSLSLGGVYIGGGIAPKILPFMQSETFLKAFYSKGRFSQMLQSMPIKLSLNPDTALLGSAHYAKDHYKN
ncbi:MAG: glucokinase [Thiovulaceae bacterium]|nr:glucokinase [Sulfurimonadaceae bacterium]